MFHVADAAFDLIVLAAAVARHEHVAGCRIRQIRASSSHHRRADGWWARYRRPGDAARWFESFLCSHSVENVGRATVAATRGRDVKTAVSPRRTGTSPICYSPLGVVAASAAAAASLRISFAHGRGDPV